MRQRSGEPGNNGADFFIRGVATMNSATPLIVLDGVEISHCFNIFRLHLNQPAFTVRVFINQFRIFFQRFIQFDHFALVFNKVRLPEITHEEDTDKQGQAQGLWSHKLFIFGIAALFCFLSGRGKGEKVE